MRDIVALLLLLLGSSEVRAQNEYYMAAEGVYQSFMQRAYYQVDRKRCEAPLRGIIATAIAGEDTSLQLTEAVEASCLDKNSAITALGASQIGNISTKPSRAYVASNARVVVIPDFFEGSAHSLAEALYQAGNKHIIIDLRNNPGGYISELVLALNFFAPGKGAPMFVRHYNDRAVEERASVRGYFAGNSIGLIVNDKTASSAEIFAAALRNWYGKHLVIIGEMTYKKGSMQIVHRPIDASILVRLTTAVITAGSKEQNIKIDGVGIQPDIYVEAPREGGGRDPQMDTARRYYDIKRLE